MNIITVTEQDTLDSLAIRYGTSRRELWRLNELVNEESLVPGLHLLAPSDYVDVAIAQAVTVSQGETLADVARRVGTTPEVLSAWNALGAQTPLRPGTVLYAPSHVTRRQIEVNAFLLPEGTASDARLLRDIRNLTYVSLYSYQVKPDGSIEGQSDAQALDAAKQMAIQPLMTLTNYDGTRFNSELGHAVLANTSLRRRVTDAAVAMMADSGFGGINLDFEQLPPGDRTLFTRFVDELASAVRRQRGTVMITLPPAADPSASSPMNAFIDYRTVSGAADVVVLMTYLWGWVGGRRGAIAPLDRVRRALDASVNQIGANRILLGLPLLGIDSPATNGGQSTTGLTMAQSGQLATRRASTIANNSAQNLAIIERSPVLWNPSAATPYFRYTSSDRGPREVWFEDALSISLKYALVFEYGLRGLSFWSLPASFPQAWYILREAFAVEKR